MVTRTLDCRDMTCPMPIVQLSMEIREIEIGQQLCIQAHDAAFLPDIAAWARMTGHELLETSDGDIKTATVRRAL